MPEAAILSVAIRGYWHTGTGRGSGNHLDALVDTDAEGLPYLAGRHLKGLLRDAVNRAEVWGLLTMHGCELTTRLFGSRGFDEGQPVPRADTLPGHLHISDARLPGDLCTWLGHPDQKHLRSGLYREIFSTAVNEETGVAQRRSLRGMQVTIPLDLEARVQLLPGPQHGTLAECWFTVLRECLPLIRAVGANRTRGLGRAVLTLTALEDA